MNFFKTDTDAKILKLETELQKLENALVDAQKLKESKEHDVNELHKISITDGVDNDKSIGKLQLEIMQLESKIKAIQGLIDSSIARLEAIETEKRQERHEDYERSIKGLQRLKAQWQADIINSIIPLLAKYEAMTGLSGFNMDMGSLFGNSYGDTRECRNAIKATANNIMAENKINISIHSMIQQVEHEKNMINNRINRRVA